MPKNIQNIKNKITKLFSLCALTCVPLLAHAQEELPNFEQNLAPLQRTEDALKAHPAENASLTVLPNEILVEIAKHLEPCELKALKHTNHFFYDLLHHLNQPREKLNIFYSENELAGHRKHTEILDCRHDLESGALLEFSIINWLKDDMLIPFQNAKNVSLVLCDELTGACLQHLKYVHTLTLGLKQLRNEDLAPLKNVYHLTLQYSENLTDESLKYVPNVRDLYLEDVNINGEGFKYLKYLNTLKITSCRRGIKHENFQHLHGVHTLNLEGCGTNDNDLQYLTHVQNLKITGACLTGEGFRHLANVRSLAISFCNNVTGASLTHLTHVHHLKVENCENIQEGDVEKFLSKGFVFCEGGEPRIYRYGGISFEAVRM